MDTVSTGTSDVSKRTTQGASLKLSYMVMITTQIQCVLRPAQLGNIPSVAHSITENVGPVQLSLIFKSTTQAATFHVRETSTKFVVVMESVRTKAVLIFPSLPILFSTMAMVRHLRVPPPLLRAPLQAPLSQPGPAPALRHPSQQVVPTSTQASMDTPAWDVTRNQPPAERFPTRRPQPSSL